jgi:hypothetical protein
VSRVGLPRRRAWATVGMEATRPEQWLARPATQTRSPSRDCRLNLPGLRHRYVGPGRSHEQDRHGSAFQHPGSYATEHPPTDASASMS